MLRIIGQENGDSTFEGCSTSISFTQEEQGKPKAQIVRNNFRNICRLRKTKRPVAYAGKISGRFRVMDGLVGGPGCPEHFHKFEKSFERKFKNALIFKEKLKSQRYIIARLYEKQFVGEILRNSFNENSIEKLKIYLLRKLFC